MQTCRRCGQTHDAYTGCTVAIRVAGRPTVIGDDEALVGNVVGDRYQVGDVIGQGSTGTVFGVQHVSFARAAAMKVLRPRFASTDLISRVFHGEARSAWSVSHPGLCEVFDIGSLPDGAPFFVMERLEGETLATRIARERLSLASAIDVMMQLLSAVAAIHARDLLLRDLRPQNIFLAHRRGCRPLLKILDLGLARLMPLDRVQGEWDALNQASLRGSTVDGGPTAIPFYLSPERTRGEHGIEPASDLFVAAVILYEALAGERPFVASSFNGVLNQICQGKTTPLHEKRSDISPDLSMFVARALSPHPRSRPASAKEMQDELRSIFEGARKGSTSIYVGPPASVAMSTAAPQLQPQEQEQDEQTMTPQPSVVADPPKAIPHEPQQQLHADVTRPHFENYRSGGESTHTKQELHELTNTDNDNEIEEGTFGRPDSFVPEPLEPSVVSSVGRAAQQAAAASLEQMLPPLIDEDRPTNAGQRMIDVGPTSSTAPFRAPAPSIDEASAENVADRTVPPPPLSGGPVDIEVDVSFDDAADKTMDLRRRAAALAAASITEEEGREEETETMQLTPELRARVDQLMANKAGATRPELPQPIPPPRAKRR